MLNWKCLLLGCFYSLIILYYHSLVSDPFSAELPSQAFNLFLSIHIFSVKYCTSAACTMLRFKYLPQITTKFVLSATNFAFSLVLICSLRRHRHELSAASIVGHFFLHLSPILMRKWPKKFQKWVGCGFWKTHFSQNLEYLEQFNLWSNST